MRPDRSPLDLNNFPDDYPHEDTPSPAATVTQGGRSHTKKKITSRKEFDKAAGKVYQCRFCSLKFSKSQALGGHMNRHRQERETETINKARELVFVVDGPPPPPPPPPQHLGLGTVQSNYHQQMRSLSSSPYPTPPPRLYPSATTAGSSYPSSYHSQLVDHHHHHATQSYMGLLSPQHANPNGYAGEGSTSYICNGASCSGAGAGGASVGQSFSGPNPAARNGPGQMD